MRSRGDGQRRTVVEGARQDHRTVLIRSMARLAAVATFGSRSAAMACSCGSAFVVADDAEHFGNPFADAGIRFLEMRKQGGRNRRPELDQVVLRLLHHVRRVHGVNDARHVVASQLLERKRHRDADLLGFVGGHAAQHLGAGGGVSGTAQPLGRRTAHLRILVGQPFLEQRDAGRLRQARQRVERRPRAFALLVERQLLGQCAARRGPRAGRRARASPRTARRRANR